MTAGSPFNIMVTAEDNNGNTVTAYTGTVTFTSTDSYPGVVLPADYTFTPSDNGTHTFTVTLFTAGMQKITVTDTANSSLTDSATVTVGQASPSQFDLTAPSTTVAGTPFNLTVAAVDPYGNPVTGYSGTVILLTTDHDTTPSIYTFTQSDNGSHTFAVTLFTAGVQTLTVSDAANEAITRTANVSVQAASATQLQVIAPSTAASGTPFDLIVVALYPYGNTATNYQGTVAFSTSDSDPGVKLPAAYTFTTGGGGDNGAHAFLAGVTLITPGNQTITVTDTANTITGNATVTISPPPGGNAAEPQTPITNAGQPAQQVVLLDRLFSSFTEKNPPLFLAHPEHKGFADDPLGGEHELLSSTLGSRLGIIPLAIK